MNLNMTEATYSKEIMDWRATLDGSLRAEDSWLALAGLIWLDDERTAFGADAALPIPLQKPGPARIEGEFVRDEEGVRLIVAAGSGVLVDGRPVREMRLDSDLEQAPSRITLGAYTMMLIDRKGRLGIRLWDNDRPQRTSHPGRAWYPLDPTYRINARFKPYQPHAIIAIPDELGNVQDNPSPGHVEFLLSGQTLRLDALEAASGGLFLLMKDETAGTETYGSGRFLVTPPPNNGDVVLDFNRAYNPPCAFTPFATCPLPPPQNFLQLPIRAGERLP